MQLLLLVICVLLATAFSRNVISVVANVRGKKFDLKADTVGDFIAQVEKLAGLTPGQQSVLFRGKLLGSNENLSEAGVSNGDVLNVLKGRQTKLPHKPSAFKAPSASQPSSSSGSKMGGFPSFPGAGVPSPEQMKETMSRMEEMLDSGVLDQLLNDPEQLEKSRVHLRDNMDQLDKMIPGFREQTEDLISSPEKWREAMMKTKAQFEKIREMKKNGGIGGGSEKSAAKNEKAAHSRKGEK